MRRRWRLGSKRRLVATMEWLRWWPNPGFFPQIEQTLGTAGNGSEALLPASGREGRAQLGERVRHLQRRPRRPGTALDPRLRLLGGVAGEEPERDRHARLDLRELETARRFAGDVVEVRGLAPDHAPERDH